MYYTRAYIQCVYIHTDLSSKGFITLSQDCNDWFDESYYDNRSDDPVRLVDHNENEMKNFKLFVTKRQRPLLPDLNAMEWSQYILPSNVGLKYLDLFDSLVELLQIVHPDIIIEALNDVMASDTQRLTFFAPKFQKMLEKFTNATALLRILFPYTNWYDHSIIRELVEACECPEGVKLLDEFDSRIDVTLPITSYPIPAPSDLMIPDESSTHTVMAVRCDQQLSSLSLKHIGVVKSLMMNTFSITKHAFVLLAISNNSSAVIFWLIPRSVVPMINNAIQESSTSLYNNGLLEVAIWSPNFSFSTGSTSRIWMIAYGNDSAALSDNVCGSLDLINTTKCDHLSENLTCLHNFVF